MFEVNLNRVPKMLKSRHPHGASPRLIEMHGTKMNDEKPLGNRVPGKIEFPEAPQISRSDTTAEIKFRMSMGIDITNRYHTTTRMDFLQACLAADLELAAFLTGQSLCKWMMRQQEARMGRLSTWKYAHADSEHQEATDW